MKTCPSCGALIGEHEAVCLNCEYVFSSAGAESDRKQSGNNEWREESREQKLYSKKKKRRTFQKKTARTKAEG